jgi:hypothetical protein
MADMAPQAQTLAQELVSLVTEIQSKPEVSPGIAFKGEVTIEGDWSDSKYNVTVTKPTWVEFAPAEHIAEGLEDNTLSPGQVTRPGGLGQVSAVVKVESGTPVFGGWPGEQENKAALAILSGAYAPPRVFGIRSDGSVEEIRESRFEEASNAPFLKALLEKVIIKQAWQESAAQRAEPIVMSSPS